MNIAFFLTPKSEVICLQDEMTMRQALEKMEYHRYSAVPIIDSEGKYKGTVTEGDMLWMMKHNKDLTFMATENIKLDDIPRHRNNAAVSISANIESLVELASCQNFVPVVDDHGVFIGIIKRSDIINYYYKIVKKTRQIAFSQATSLV